mgnify:CR=1 FL=1
MKTLKVYLIGAGLGSPHYLTQQAQDYLQKADVLIYDALVDEAILDLVPESCHKVYVGKRGGEKSTPQSEINRLLVHYAQRNQYVVRLKNGDPFIFGLA